MQRDPGHYKGTKSICAYRESQALYGGPGLKGGLMQSGLGPYRMGLVYRGSQTYWGGTQTHRPGSPMAWDILGGLLGSRPL